MPAIEPLCEIRHVRQHDHEPLRRWFYSPTMDLILWLNEFGQPFGFQLCYDVGRRERAITWESDRGFSHCRVDAGDYGANYRMTPILHPAAGFDRDRVLGDFLAAAGALPPAVQALVREVLAAWPERPPVSASRPAHRRPRGWWARWWAF